MSEVRLSWLTYGTCSRCGADAQITTDALGYCVVCRAETHAERLKEAK